jgi:hypothetical protein
VHQKTLSPDRSRERLHATGKSSSVDVANELFQKQKIPKPQKSHASRSKTPRTEPDATRSSSNDLAEPSTKKISKILYEIGSILSFVGLGKDYKSQAQTRRSQEKKSDMLTPTRTSPSQSHSLTRFHKTYPYRFKSLTCQPSVDQSRLTPEHVVVTEAATMSSSSSNLLSPRMAVDGKMNNQEMLKKYSKSVDCPHYSQNSTSTEKIQRQQSVNCSPLIPRRADYEPMTRVTIQRQQRVEQSPPRLSRNYLSVDQAEDHVSRPLTLDLRKGLVGNGNGAQTLSTASTSEDDYLISMDSAKEREREKEREKERPKTGAATFISNPNRDSLSLSISSIASSSQPSSVSPVASPRLAPRLRQFSAQKTIDETLLTPNQNYTK